MSRWFETYGLAEVAPNLWVGAYPLDEHDVRSLAQLGVQRILNLVEDREYRAGERGAVQRALRAAAIEEHRLTLEDFGGLPPDRIDTAVDTVCRWLEQGARAYVHCRAGWQRSAAIAAGVVALREGLEIERALEHVQQRKLTADPLPHQREDLRRWWSARHVAG